MTNRISLFIYNNLYTYLNLKSLLNFGNLIRKNLLLLPCFVSLLLNLNDFINGTYKTTIRKNS